MELTAENTAVVVDSTADFPDAPARFANWRVVPLYVLFGDESFRDYVELPAARLLRPPAHVVRSCRRRRSRRPATSPPSTRSSRGYERDLFAPPLREVLGDVGEREARRRRAGGRADPRRRHGVGLAGDHAARPGRPAAPRARHDGRGDRGARRVVQARRRARLHGRHARVPRPRRPDRPGAGAGRASCSRSSRSSRSTDGEIVPVKRVRGNKKAFAEFQRTFEEGRSTGPSLRSAIAHADAPDREQALAQHGSRRPAERADRHRRRCSARSSAPTPARAQSASSGSTIRKPAQPNASLDSRR